MQLTDKEYQAAYNMEYGNITKLSDENIIDTWKYHQIQMLYSKDMKHKIISDICLDILRQRGNTYIDDMYPKD